MKIQILGTRGVPAKHGGFETFAEGLAFYLVERGHEVTVYCQEDDSCPIFEDVWNGVRRLHISSGKGSFGTITFDWRSVRESLKRPGLPLVLGYNTACFSLLYRLAGRKSVMNMDGIEWKREKWSGLQRIWLRFNEYAGSRLSTHLVADHPEIGRHLARHVSSDKITVIPYGADPLPVRSLPDPTAEAILAAQGLRPNGYALLIARPEPENSLLEIVQAFSARSRGIVLYVLGRFSPETNEFHRKVMAAGSEEVIFPGAIYDKDIVETLRRYARVYLHGHRVGGTNPSLVEALAAGSAVIAHDNLFTRWVAGSGAVFFQGSEDLADTFDCVLNNELQLARMRACSLERYEEEFTQQKIMGRHFELLQKFVSEV